MLTNRKIASMIEAFIRRPGVFGKHLCNFTVTATPAYHVKVILVASDFDPFVTIPQGKSAVTILTTTDTSHVYNLNPHIMIPKAPGVVISKEAKEVLGIIVNHIIENYSENEQIFYSFYILGNAYIEKNPQGSIAKPTKIDHKTFKGRKRRGVVESIIDSYGRYN